MKFINYIEAKVPTWAMSYLVNGDATGITDEDKQQVDQWVEKSRAALKQASPGAWYEFIDSCQESGSFTHRPAFGLACDTVDAAIVACVSNDDPREAMQLPWEEDPEDEVTLPPAQVEQLTRAACLLGVEHGANAAEWYAQDAFGGRCTRNHKESAARVLEMVEDGDPELWDSINLPNLSGEYSGDLTTRTLAIRLCDEERIDHDSVAPEIEDEIASAYEDGVGTGFVDRLCEMARSVAQED